MRRRRLYRFFQNQTNPWSPRPRIHEAAAPHPIAGYRVQDDGSDFDRGVQHGIELAMQQQGRIVAEARREALVAVHSDPYLLMARRGGYDEGFAAGMQAAQRASAPRGSQFTYADVENARRRGFEEGRSATTQGGIPRVDESAMRRKIVDEMLEDCRVIAESNPNMAPGVNAVRHRIKKRA